MGKIPVSGRSRRKSTEELGNQGRYVAVQGDPASPCHCVFITTPQHTTVNFRISKFSVCYSLIPPQPVKIVCGYPPRKARHNHRKHRLYRRHRHLLGERDSTLGPFASIWLRYLETGLRRAVEFRAMLYTPDDEDMLRRLGAALAAHWDKFPETTRLALRYEAAKLDGRSSVERLDQIEAFIRRIRTRPSDAGPKGKCAPPT